MSTQYYMEKNNRYYKASNTTGSQPLSGGFWALLYAFAVTSCRIFGASSLPLQQALQRILNGLRQHIFTRQTKNKSRLMLLLLLPLSQTTQAEDIIWQFESFGTLGYSETNRYEDRVLRRDFLQSPRNLDDNGFLVDSRIGIKVDAILSDNVEFVAQAALRSLQTRRVVDYIDAAFFRFIVDDQVQFRVGRLPFDVFFLSDRRNVSYAYDWVRPPIETYGIIIFNAVDGGRFLYNWGDFDSTWEWSLTYGTSNVHIDNSDSAGGLYDSIEAEPLISTSLSWRNLDWNVRLSTSRIKFKNSTTFWTSNIEQFESLRPIWSDPARITDGLFNEDFIYYTSLGALHNVGKWKFQAELSTIRTDMVIYQGEQAYLHVARRIDDFTPFVTLRMARDKRDIPISAPPPGLGLEPIFGLLTGLSQSFKFNQRSVGVGVRYDFAPKKALKAQCDTYFFKAGSASLISRVDQQYLNDETRSWCSLNFDWVF